MIPVDRDTVSPPAADGRRRDSLPPWVVVLLAVFLFLRVYDVGVAPLLSRGHSAAAPSAQAKENGMDDESMQDLLQTDLEAKLAFVLARPGEVARPDPKALRQALDAADSLQRQTRNAPSAARRVILLRALLAKATPDKGVLPPLAAGKNRLDPLAAFSTALPAGLPPGDRALYAREGRLWQTVFQGGALSARQTADAAAQIRRLPNIRWWQYPALIALYTNQGDLSEASRYGSAARAAALPGLLPFGLLTLFRLALILLGVLLLLYFAVRRAQKPPSAEGAPPPLDLWPTVPAVIPPAERRLGAGDLMGIFVLYLVSREVLSLLLSGFGVPHLFHFRGLLGPFLPALRRLPLSERITLEIVLEAADYLLSAVPPFVALWTMARRRGASLADEIGWTRRNLGTNLLYGIGGFAVASALIVPVGLLARRLFRHAPDPSNPVIPQLIGAPGVWAPLVLILLASFAAPVVEEVLFRGVLYNAARMRLGVWPAIVLTGLVFGFVHPVGIAEMLAIGTLGGVFAWMAETRKSLAPSMFAHFLQNFTTTLLLLSVLSG